ncbi:unnamed protein product [Pocillopora meandrina]|uniref:Uncharacterized protein n=1 Tax=Pocillopora meandrina TaxID=46732 RepID=A0AAU9W252_9CNID|nr:unnamed protein product [Pocillopora meandrina]
MSNCENNDRSPLNTQNSAMKWTKEHNVLLGKKVMLFELQKYKLGSRERGNCLDQIAKSLNQL